MTSPYINTVMYTTISLLPSQMNNDLYSHLKKNVIRRVEGRCFRHYGYITKVYELLNIEGGVLEPENPKAAATYNIKFSCRLCYPLKNRFITCKVVQTTQALTSLINGPVKVLLTNDRINGEKFITSRVGILVRIANTNSVRPLVAGDYVKIKIESRKFNKQDTIIMCMGILDSMSTEEEIRKFEADEYNDSGKFIDYDTHIRLEEEKNDIDMIGENAESGEPTKQEQADE